MKKSPHNTLQPAVLKYLEYSALTGTFLSWPLSVTGKFLLILCSSSLWWVQKRNLF